VAWKLDRLGRDLRHLVNLVHDLTRHGISLKIRAGRGAQLDTTTANGRLVFGIFAALAEFEHALIVEGTQAGLASARARGRNGGRPFKMTVAKLRLAQAAMGKPGIRSANCAPNSASHARSSTAMSTRTAVSGRMAKSYSTECEHGRPPFRAAEVEFENDNCAGLRD
jgi:hypothetical protein